LAGIAAADALCGRGLKKRFRGDDHHQAADLLELASTEGRQNKRAFLRLLDLKDQAHYGFDVSRADARKSVVLAQTLARRAEASFQR
jgi:hypothetical protein